MQAVGTIRADPGFVAELIPLVATAFYPHLLFDEMDFVMAYGNPQRKYLVHGYFVRLKGP